MDQPDCSFLPGRYPALHALLGEAIEPGKRSLADEAHDRILLKIIEGELGAGAELKTTRLASELGMSRTPVIQALARLTAGGMVAQSLNQRAIVRPGAENWLIDLHRVRQLIEPEAARLSAGRVSAEVMADLRILTEDSRPDGRDTWREAARWLDQALHGVIAESCGNLALREIIVRCWGYKRLSYLAQQSGDRQLREGWRQHADLVEAIAQGSGEEAARLMAEHLQSAAQGAAERIV